MANDVGYYDVETSGWATFVVGEALAPDGRRVVVWHRPGDLLQWMLDSGVREWRAHNGGRFDALLMLSLAQDAGASIGATLAGSSILRATIRLGSKRITLTDTYALAPVRLEALAEAAGGPLKGGLSFGYDEIPEGLDPHSPMGKELATYLTRDVEALAFADAAWRETLRDVLKVEPKLTIGGAAWNSARASIEELVSDRLDVPLTIGQYEAQRSGYFGGRVEVFQPEAPAGWRFDRNSSYPAALTRVRVPMGHRSVRVSWNGEPGTVSATVDVPECEFPPLPLRMGGRVVYPTGRIRGTWTALELENATRLGARIHSVQRSIVARETTDALKGWCEHVWGERVARPAWAKLLKLVANSLTGKLAQHPERESLRYGDAMDAPAGCAFLTRPDEHGGAWWRVPTVRVSPCARPEWSAYLTAEARVELLEQLRAAPGALYCDTDSVYCVGAHTRNLGAGLGEWKTEGAMTEWRALAPKVYAYTDERGRRVVKGKGLSGLTPEGFDALREGAAWRVTSGVSTLLTSLRENGRASFVRRDSSRSLAPRAGWVGARVLPAGHSKTRAPTIQEAKELWSADDEEAEE